MPFPTTRHPVPDVGAAGDQGSGVAPRPYAQVSGLLWFRQFEHRQIRPLSMRQVRRHHIRRFPEKTAAASLTHQTDSYRSGQLVRTRHHQ